MVTAQQVIEGFENLSPKERQIVINYFISEVAYPIEEDNDEHLQEDIAEADRIKAEEKAEGIQPTPFEEIWERIQSKNNKTMILTQNREAKAVLQDIHSYEQTQESLALLKIVASSNKNLREGKFQPLEESFKSIQARIEKEKLG